MKKTFQILAIILAVFSVSFLVSCNDKPKPPVTPDYDAVPDEDIDTLIQEVFTYANECITGLGQDDLNVKYEQSAAMKITADMFKGYEHNRVFRMAACINTDPVNPTRQYSDLRFWIRKELDGADIWSQSVDSVDIKLDSWTSVLMDKYYIVTAKEDLYFGYTIKANGKPLGTDGDPVAKDNGIFVYDINQGWLSAKDLTGLGVSNFGNVCIKAYVTGDCMPTADASFNVIAPDYVKPNTPFSFAVSPLNNSSEIVSSYDVVVYDNGSEVFRQNTESKIKPGESGTYIGHDVKLNGESTHKVKFAIENVNGQERHAMNYTFEKDIYVDSKVVDRQVFMEMFSTAMCPNCPTGHDNIEKAIEELGCEDRLTWITHHAGYTRDSYTIPQNDTAESIFYNYNGIFAPAIMFDRVNYAAAGAKFTTNPTPGPVLNLNGAAIDGILDDIMRIALTSGSPISLSFDHTFDASTGKLTVDINADVFFPIADKVYIGVGLIENGIVGTQSGAGGTYTHNEVTRDFVTSVLGKQVNASGSKLTLSTSKILKTDGWKTENMEIVVWISEGKNGDANSWHVYQSAKAKLIK